INRRSGWGVPSSPLRLGATWGCVRSVKVLLPHGAEVDNLDVKAQTPLFMVVSNGHREHAKVLLDAGASPADSIYSNCSLLLITARDGDMGILHVTETNIQVKLSEQAAKLVACSGPLCLTTMCRHLEDFKTLLLYGADPDYNCTEERVIAQVKEPKPLLETCLRHGCRSEFIELLIDFGASVYLSNITADEMAHRSKGLELLLQ
ncbi:PREDICTED: LOW QUALITY PROTEIN: ankyrin repeat and SOCS box protein 12-like, partial [Pterocles gutturalis]|uniref:LOW QUALITY PROTEIN: ankyrin repeat and SOCS box protein 12-like n=1 Tax=Pterocles gutturalis TaxID=240206 RepID=UPI00052932C6